MKFSGSQWCVTRGIEAESPKLLRVCEASASPNLRLNGVHTRCYRHSHISNITFKAITLMSCAFKGIAFQALKLTAYSCVLHQKGEYYVDIFWRNMTLTPRLFDTVPQQGY